MRRQIKRLTLLACVTLIMAIRRAWRQDELARQQH
jgi:hypothetical protein